VPVKLVHVVVVVVTVQENDTKVHVFSATAPVVVPIVLGATAAVVLTSI